MKALELDKRLKAEQAFYDAARDGKSLEEARQAAVAAAEKVQYDYVIGKTTAPTARYADSQ